MTSAAAIFTGMISVVEEPARSEGRKGAARAQTPNQQLGPSGQCWGRAQGGAKRTSVTRSSHHTLENQEQQITELVLFSKFGLTISPVSGQHESRWAGRKGSLLCLQAVTDNEPFPI